MNELKSPEIKIAGFDFVKMFHIILQITFIPAATRVFQHNFQILVPLPIGIFILLSIMCNLVVYIPHFFEHRVNVRIKKTPENTSIKTVALRKRKSVLYKITKGTRLSKHIHGSFGWAMVFMLGFAWNIFLSSEGAKLLRVKAFYQGLPMFSYGFITIVTYLMMWLLPDTEIHLDNPENPQKSTTLLIPYTTITFSPLKISFGRQWIEKMDNALDSEFSYEKQDLKAFLKENWIQVFQFGSWLIVYIVAATFLFDFYHYQYVGAFSFLVLMYYLRELTYRNQESMQNPWWIYPFWVLSFHEIGIKAWYLTSLGIVAPSSIIWTLPVSWILFVIIFISTILEVAFHPTMKGNKKWIIVVIILLIDLGLQFTAFYSATRILPFYISLIEFGPLI